MKIYYDTNSDNVLIENLGRYFPNGTLEAIEEFGKISIRNKNTGKNELHVLFSEIQKIDGSVSGTDNASCVIYLNNEFQNGKMSGSGAFSLLLDTVTITNSRIKSTDKIIVSPQGALLNDILYVSSVLNGSFVVSRKALVTASALTSGLAFNYIRL